MSRNKAVGFIGAVAIITVVGAVSAATIMGTPSNNLLICSADSKATWLGKPVQYNMPLKVIDSAGTLPFKGGPIWTVGATSYGDIVPPYSFTPTKGPVIVFPGHNWTEQGQYIWDNGCLILK